MRQGSTVTNLSVFQAWADAFRSSPDLTGVVHIYEELKRKGVEFPMADLDALSPIHTPQRVSGSRRLLQRRRNNEGIPDFCWFSAPWSETVAPCSKHNGALGGDGAVAASGAAWVTPGEKSTPTPGHAA